MESLTQTEVLALEEALDDEYHSWTTYDQVVSMSGFLDAQVAAFDHVA